MRRLDLARKLQPRRRGVGERAGVLHVAVQQYLVDDLNVRPDEGRAASGTRVERERRRGKEDDHTGHENFQQCSITRSGIAGNRQERSQPEN